MGLITDTHLKPDDYSDNPISASYDWIDNQWTVSVQAGVSQLVNIGQQPMSFGITGRYYAKASSGSADWALRFTMTFIFPQ